MGQLRTRRPAFQENLACLHSSRGWEELRAVHADFLRGVQLEAQRIGYGMDFPLLEEPGFSADSSTRVWRSCRVRGVILYNCRPEAPLDFPWEDFAWVVAGSVTNVPKLDRVGNEIYQIMKLAIQGLAHRGYRRPGLALPMGGGKRQGFRWVGAFLANAMHYDLDLNLDSVFRAEWSPSDFAAWYHQFRPDVILSLHDEPMKWLQSMGEKVPDKVGFLHLAANISRLATAGVAQDFAAVGRAAVQALDGQLRRNDLGIPAAPSSLTVAGIWKEGNTMRPSGALPSTSPSS